MLTPAQSQLIEKWKAADLQAKNLWKEILVQGLYAEANGLNWREDMQRAINRNLNCCISTLDSEREFYSNVKGSPKRYGKFGNKIKSDKIPELSEDDLADFVD